MSFLSGQDAVAGIQQLLSSSALPPLLVFEPDVLQNPDRQANLLAIGNPENAIIIDIPASSEALRVLAATPVLAAHHAQKAHQALLRLGLTTEQVPKRWACMHIIEQLLSAGRDLDLALPAIAKRHELPEISNPNAGLQAMLEHARQLSVLLQHQIAKLQQLEMQQVSKIEALCIPVIAELELHGMALDKDIWLQACTQCQNEQHRLTTEIIAALTPATPFETTTSIHPDCLKDKKHLQRLLEAQGYRPQSMSKRDLQALPAPLGPALHRYSEVEKILSTYGAKFIDFIHRDGRLHPSFDQIGASTGRMSSHQPNLQAMTKSKAHRLAFNPGAERRLLMADYATCELRILAEMSGDPIFSAAFNNGEDLHSRVAAHLWPNDSAEKIKTERRQQAKAVNFGIVYGISAAGLSQSLQIPMGQAHALMQHHTKSFPQIFVYLNDTANAALQRGYAATLAGRRLHLPSNGQQSKAEKAHTQRLAKNMPIQGSSADITKLALSQLRQALLADEDCYIVNVVHDEIVVEAPAAKAEAVAKTMQNCMQQAGQQLVKSIPMLVDTQIATAWVH